MTNLPAVAKATAAAPTHTEGTTKGLSQTLSGALRTTFTGSVAVTGTFWQATQPVSGTFWQATQPVSLASVPSHPVTNAGTFAVQASADATAATGGIASTARLASAAATTNATNVKASAGRVYSLQGYNAAAYPVYLVLYDSAATPPVPGTTTIRKKIPIPAGVGFALDWPLGMSFATGIGYAFTKLAADSDTTALAAADVLQFNMDYV